VGRTRHRTIAERFDEDRAVSCAQQQRVDDEEAERDRQERLNPASIKQKYLFFSSRDPHPVH
jgi:hypothetical protein